MFMCIAWIAETVGPKTVFLNSYLPPQSINHNPLYIHSLNMRCGRVGTFERPESFKLIWITFLNEDSTDNLKHDNITFNRTYTPYHFDSKSFETKWVLSEHRGSMGGSLGGWSLTLSCM